MELSFKQYFNEGKALDVSPDMVNFAKEIVKKLQNRNWEFAGSGPINNRIVNSKYGSKKVTAKLYSKNNANMGSARNNEVVLMVPTISLKQNNQSNDPFSLPKSGGNLTIDWDSLDLDQIYHTIIHELVHIFDPKQNLEKSKWMQSYSMDYPEGSPEEEKNYWLHPTEQDSYMSQYSRILVKNLLKKNNGDKNKVKQQLSFIKPSNYIEELWYKNPKMWRKYLNTVYSVLSGAI
jgi:hypothetical protein